MAPKVSTDRTGVPGGLVPANRIARTERLACVDVPALPLQLLLRRYPDWCGRPAAVVA